MEPIVVKYELTPAAMTLAGGKAELNARFADRLSGLVATVDAQFCVETQPSGVCITHPATPGALVSLMCENVGVPGYGALYILTAPSPDSVRQLFGTPAHEPTLVELVRDLVMVWPEVLRWEVHEMLPEARLSRFVERARDWVIRDQRASTSYVQRRLHVSYTIAVQILGILETLGVISAPDAQGRRTVLVARP